MCFIVVIKESKEENHSNPRSAKCSELFFSRHIHNLVTELFQNMVTSLNKGVPCSLNIFLFGRVNLFFSFLQGKSTILKRMELQGNIKSEPVIGMPIETVKSGQNVRITAWDVGGPGKIRSMWEHFFSVTTGRLRNKNL